MSPLDSYIDSSCENTAYKPTLKKNKRKNRVLAVILGLFFGPFGMLYFGWAVLLTTLYTYIVVFLLAALFSPFRIPTQGLGFILNLFFGFCGFMLASLHNELTETDDLTRLAEMNLAGMNGWLIRVILVTTGLYSMVMFFSEGRWIVAILTPILFIPVAIWCVENMFYFLTAIVLGFFTRSEHKENTHYQEEIKTDKQFSESLALASYSTQENPSENRRDVQAYCDRGHTYTEKGEYDLAIADWTKVIELDPSWVGGYYYRGQAYTRKGEYERAITDFTKVIETDPSWVGGFYYQGQVYTHKGEYASAYCERGRAYRCKAEYELAIADYTKAIEIAPEFVSAYCDRGHAYTEKGEYDLAIADWTKVIETDPSWVGGYHYRGQAYTKKGEYERAILDYTKVIEIQPSTVLGQAAHYGLGCIYLKIGDTDSALEHYDALKRLDENAANELLSRIQSMAEFSSMPTQQE